MIAEAHYEAWLECVPIVDSWSDLMQVHPCGELRRFGGIIPIPDVIEPDDWTNYVLMELDEYFLREPKKLTIGCWRVNPPA